MKTLSTDALVTLISRAINTMATGKKTTVGYRTIHLLVAGVVLGNVIDLKGTVSKTISEFSKLSEALPILESQGVELKELRRLREEDHRLREEDHRAIEDIRDILKRNRIALISTNESGPTAKLRD